MLMLILELDYFCLSSYPDLSLNPFVCFFLSSVLFFRIHNRKIGSGSVQYLRPNNAQLQHGRQPAHASKITLYIIAEGHHICVMIISGLCFASVHHHHKSLWYYHLVEGKSVAEDARNHWKENIVQWNPLFTGLSLFLGPLLFFCFVRYQILK